MQTPEVAKRGRMNLFVKLKNLSIMIQIKAKQQNVSFEKNVEDVKTSLITARRVIFIPSKEVQQS